MRRGSKENQASVVPARGQFARQDELGAGLRDRLDIVVADEILAPDRDMDSDPISPELILVSSPEVARLAREQLPVYPPQRSDDVGRTVAATSVRESQPTNPALPPEQGQTWRRRARWWAAAAAVVLAAVTAGVVIKERQVEQASRASTQSSTKAARVRTGTGTTAPSSLHRSHRTSPLERGSEGSGAAALGTAPPATTTATTVTTPAAAEGHPPAAPSRTPKAPAPGGALPPSSEGPSNFVPSRVFAWPADADATSYLVRFYRDGVKVFETDSTKPHLTVPQSFRFKAGRYRWKVLPVLGSTPTVRYGAPIVDSSFVITSG